MTNNNYSYDGLVVKLIDAGSDEPIKVLREGRPNKIRESRIPDINDVTLSLFVKEDSPFRDKIDTVLISLNDGQKTNIEGREPFTLNDDFDSDPTDIDFLGGTLPLGRNKIEFTLNLNNGRQKSVIRHFNILERPDLKVGIVNSDTDSLITLIKDGDRVPARLLRGRPVTIVGFDASYDVESALLNFNDGDIVRIENEPPYALLGDINGDFYGERGLIPLGPNNINFKLYSEDNLGGDLLGIVDVNFSVVRCCGGYPYCGC